MNCPRCEHESPLGHCYVGLARLSGRTGKRNRADEHLATATAMYRELGMAYWLETAAAVPIDAC
jgi:hypothetical protein